MYAPTIDRADLIEAVVSASAQPDLDYGTLQLIHEAGIALGPVSELDFVHVQLAPLKERLAFDPSETKFPLLKERIVADLRKEQIEQFLRELGTGIDQPTSIIIGGSVALTLQGFPRKPTDDIDVVDEIPLAIRERHALTAELARSHGIRITAFQSHFLPDAWERRTHSLPAAGKLQIQLVDAYDVMASKVYSERSRDRQHLRQLAPSIEKAKLHLRLQMFTRSLWQDEKYRGNAIQNWYIVFGDDLDLV